MSMNILNDISKVYLEQVVDEEKDSYLETDMKKRRENNEKAIEDMKKTKAHRDMVAAARKKFDEALDPVGQEDDDIDNDGDTDKSDKYLHNRRKVVGKAISKKKKTRVKKESFSDWRDDLSELIEVIDSKKIEEKKNIKNKVVINPKLGEAVEELGGTLLEMVEIKNADCIFDDLSESDVFLLSDNLIEEVVEEFFFECIQEGYGIEEIENVLVESIDVSAALLIEAKVTLGHDTDIKSDRLEKVKSAVKKVGKGLARGVGYVAGAAVRGARAAGREFSKGYERGRGGSSGEDSSQASSSQSDTKETGSKRPGLLGRIGSALKSGLKRAVGAGARAVSRGARNVARRMEDGENKNTSNVPVTKTNEKVVAKPAATPKPAAKAAPKRRMSKLEKDELLSSIRSESKAELDEKLNLKKAEMGTVIKDFYKSDAPQFKGRTKEERRKMAVAAKLTAERGGLKLGEQMVDEPVAPAPDPAIDKNRQNLDKQKIANLKMLQQKQQMFQRQKLQMQKSGKLPLDAG